MGKVMSGIYQISNLVNGKCYIGSAVYLNKRRNQHFDGSWSNIHLQRAMRKYGKESFRFDILEIVKDKNLLLVREQFWLDDARSRDCKLYNIALVAGSSLGVVRTEKYKLNLSIKKKGKKGHPCSEEAKEKISNANKGHIAWNKGLTKETDARVAESVKKGGITKTGRVQSPEHIEKRVSQLRGKRWHWKKPKSERHSSLNGRPNLALKGRKLGPQSPESRLNKSLALRGRKITWADKISQTLTGRGLSESHKLAVGSGLRARYARMTDEEYKRKFHVGWRRDSKGGWIAPLERERSC